MPRTARLRLLTIAVALAAVWLLALLFGGPASPVDTTLSLALRPDRRDALVEAAWMVTWLGDWLVLVPLTLAAAGWLAWRGARRQALLLIAITAAVRLLVSLQKLWFARPRPDVEQFMVEVSHSFPSAHAANSATTLLAIAVLLAPSPTTRAWAIAAAVVASLVVGISRVVLGVHWPTDVVGGWAVAGLATMLLWQQTGAKPSRRRKGAA